MSSLYACLRSPRMPDVAVAVAKEFSPRLQRYGTDAVVLDVGGLGRLLGDPQAIGRELASRIAEFSHGTRIADSHHGTRISQIADSSHGTRISQIADSSHGTRISRIADSSHGTRISRIADSSHGTRISADLHEGDHGPRHSVSSEEDLRRSARSASRDDTRSRVAVAPTQVGAMLLSAAYPGLTVVTGDVESALASVRLEVLRYVFAEIHGVSREDPWRFAQSASREMDQRSAKSASHETDQRSAKSASRETDQRSAQSASREMDQRSAQSASREMDQRSAKSASHETDQRSAKSASREIDQRSATREQDPRSEQVFEVLERWGLTTLGEYAALPAGALSARLGQIGIALQRMARGVDATPLVPDPDLPRFLERVELEWPIDGLEPLAFVLARLLEPLSTALERADRAAAAIHVHLRLVDRSEHVRMLQLPAAIRDPKVLRTLLVLDLESHPPPAAIDIITIEVDPAPGRVLQYSLLERARPSAETLATLTARLGALVGESRCGQAFLLDSHGPDAFAMHRFAPDEAPPVAQSGSDLDFLIPAAAFRKSRSDPGQTHALEGVVLRRFRPPIAIRVTIERGRPRYVFIDRRGMPGGQVEQCAGPWRSSGVWWGAKPWSRDEWDVALSDGAVCRLFQARDSEQWFLDGVFD